MVELLRGRAAGRRRASGRRAPRSRAASAAGCSTRSTGRSTTRAGCRRGAPPPCVVDAGGAARERGLRPGRGRAVQRRARGGRDAERRALRLAAPPARRRRRGDVRRRAPPRRGDRGRDRARCCARSARCGRSGAGRSSSPGSPPGGCTGGSRPTSSRGTGIRARCWWPRRAVARGCRAVARRGAFRVACGGAAGVRGGAPCAQTPLASMT